jgi:hypothetical protein
VARAHSFLIAHLSTHGGSSSILRTVYKMSRSSTGMLNVFTGHPVSDVEK